MTTLRRTGAGPSALTLGSSQLALPLDWCQRWRDRTHSWRPRSEGGFDRARYDWSVLDETDARRFCSRHHYSGSFPAAKLSIGMYEGDELVGVAVLGIPVQCRVLTIPFPDLQPYAESVELSRFVLLDRVPANAESWLLARLFGHLRAATPIRGVVAFSDPQPRYVGEHMVMPGHWGTIYQAKGSVYLGRSRARWLTMLPDATVLNDRALSKLATGDRGWRYVVNRLVALGAAPPTGSGPPPQSWTVAALAEVSAARVRHGGNLRYAFPLGRRVRVGLPAQPYPKRGDAQR